MSACTKCLRLVHAEKDASTRYKEAAIWLAKHGSLKDGEMFQRMWSEFRSASDERRLIHAELTAHIGMHDHSGATGSDPETTLLDRPAKYS